MPKITNAQYAEMVENCSPKSKTVLDTLRAFLCGGGVCIVGELITHAWLWAGAGDAAPGAASMTLVFIGALLTGLGVYDNFAKVAGAGALVPITGFANAVSSPALEFRAEGMVTGLAAKMFIIAGPVLVYGTLTSVIYGLLLCLAGAA